jgi:pyruvate carboxylase subunit A
MIAKLIVWAPTWEVAVDRMRAALETYEITGVKTTIPLLINIMKDTDFRAGKFTTKYLEEKPHLFDYPEHRDKEDFVAIIASAIANYHGL